MKGLCVACAAAVAVAWGMIAPGKPAEVYKSWTEVEELVKKTWRPVVVVFAQEADNRWMGGSAALMGQPQFKKPLEHLVLIKAAITGQGQELKLADTKNQPLFATVTAQAGRTLPVFGVLGPDMVLVKSWGRADPAAILNELGEVLAKAIKQYKPLNDKELKEAEELLEKARKEEAEGKKKEALARLSKIMKMNENCTSGRQAKEMYERLKEPKETPGAPEPKKEEEKVEGEKKEEDKGKETPKVTSAAALIKTDFGDIEIELLTDKAPKVCERFIKMAKDGIYDDSSVEYVEHNKFIQLAPAADKKLPEEIEADFNDEKHVPGTVAMAHGSDEKKVGAAFYIALAKLPDRDGGYSIFGKVTYGLMAAETICSAKTLNNKPVERISIKKIEIKE